MSIELRTATAADEAAVRDLTRRAYAAWVPVIGREPKPMTADYAAALAKHRFDLLEREGRLVALVETVRDDRALVIVNIAVDPDLHGQGIGRALLAHAEALAAADGLRLLRLFTNARMARNLRIYASAGYAVERVDGAAVHLTKRLAHPPLLFLPGAGGSPDYWRPLAKLLPPDWPRRHLGWPGLGHQPADPAVSGMGDLVRLAGAQLDDGPCDLLAQSMGGVVALLATLERPDTVRRLVLAVTSGGVDAAARAAALYDWRASYRRNHALAAGWITQDRTDLTARIGEIACPVLLLFGEADPIAPPFVGERLAGLLPRATLHIVPGGDHDLVVSRAAEVAPLITAHLA